MDTESKDQPSGSLPRRYIDKLRAMRADIDEIIGYLARIDGTPPAPLEINTTRYRSGRPGGHILTILSIRGPCTASEILEELRRGGRLFGESATYAIARVKQSLSQMELHNKVEKLEEWRGDPRDYPGKWDLKK